ncbi:MAG: ASKHA domain-containing protein [Solidesulfovibrio sp. DCME]|uniref:ASKHA domain-containing protein n=1 Tax=Solidesulfovibrio sp. DCME TaxID=3447380 RepID=UPI003D10B17D
MPVIRLPECGRAVAYAPGPSLLDILAEAGLMPPSPCGAAGICGKCAVTVTGGDIPPPSQQEQGLFSASALAQGRRLACGLFPQADLDVDVPLDGRGGVILADGYLPDFRLEPSLAKRTVVLDPGPAGSHEAGLAAALGETGVPARVLRGLSFAPGQRTAVYDDGELLALEAGDTTARLFGLAVDIGTTTVVAALVDLRTGLELAAETAINPQKRWGFDVLTRLGYVMEHPGEGVALLQRAVVDCVNGLIRKLAARTGVAAREIYALVVAANTTMLHLLLGVDPSPLGLAPYTPPFTAAKRLPAAAVGLAAGPGAVLYCLPSVSAFVGADIVAGLQVAGLGEARDTALFIDIGTNGEIVLAHEGKLCACSCAAGPALEGMNISCGMGACAGAVEAVRLSGEGLELATIGGAPPAGVCGSGLLSAVTAFLRAGCILPRGNLVKASGLAADDPRRPLLCERDGKPALRLGPGEAGLALTQKDVRQVQLAKGAILSGLLALLERHGLGVEAVDRVLIAGQFGRHLPVDSLTGCGILPARLGDRVSYLGNTAKSGATLALLSLAARRGMDLLAARVDSLELSRLKDFDRRFVACLDFPAGA